MKLATFRINEEEWEKFQEAAAEQGVSASSLLVNFCSWTNKGNLLDSPKTQDTDSIDERIETAIDAKIAAIAPDTDQRITASIAAAFSTFTPTMLEMEKHISFLDAKIEESEKRIIDKILALLNEPLGESLA